MKITKSKIYGACKEIREGLTNVFKKFAETKDIEVLKESLKVVQDQLTKLIEEVNQ